MARRNRRDGVWLRNALLAWTVVAAVVWVGSAWWWIGVELPPYTLLSLDEGTISQHDYLGVFDSAQFYNVSPAGGEAIGPFRWWFVFGDWPMATWSIPLWPFVLLSVAASVYQCRRVARSFAQNSCSTCGYDLRGLQEGTKCPECGNANVLSPRSDGGRSTSPVPPR